MHHATDGKQRGRNQVCVISQLRRRSLSARSNRLTGKQLKQILRTWLSPSDPSTNHNIARKVQHKGAAVWFFRGSIFIEWKSTGSLLWIHGKRAFLSVFSSSQLLTFSDLRSGLREKHHLVCWSLPAHCRNLIFRQLLRHRRHHGRMRNWIGHHGLFLLRLQGSQQANLSRSPTFPCIPAFLFL